MKTKVGCDDLRLRESHEFETYEARSFFRFWILMEAGPLSEEYRGQTKKNEFQDKTQRGNAKNGKAFLQNTL